MLRILLVLVVGIAAAAEPAVTPEAYREQLRLLGTTLDAGANERATALAQHIAGLRVAWPAGELPGDPTLHALLARGALAAARQRAAAIESEIARLGASQPAVAPGDRAGLARLAQREAEAGTRLRAGGGVGGNPLDPHHLPPSISERLLAAGEWLGDRVIAMFRWIRDLFFPPGKKPSDGDGGTVVILTLVLVGVVVVVVGVLALMAWRRGGPATLPADTAAAPAPAADADPRSRAADEWARYAVELARLGRHREAIRAWYHAMLADCWSHGLLHHRIGRTNWEYALSLPAALDWRARFHDLTQRFDQAWYGGRVGVDEAQGFAIEAEQVLKDLRRQRSVA
jgi:hypothetical protein